ncbi:MAG: Y_Y_Y domain protein [Methanosaeta sp. PtaU1.Bin112]|nr:MAG: Y_Y_Y domain protein [Methanosaeta sp. PtaU1.Bin112]
MRLAWPPPRHLIASVLISAIALALVNLSPSSLQGILSPLALILVFFIPGYLAILCVFPGKNDLSGFRRALLCLASSAILAGALGLILRSTPRGLQSASLATILSFAAIFLAAVAYGRWSNLPRKRRFTLLPKRGLGSDPVPRAALAVLLLGTCFIAALAFSFGPSLFSLQEASGNPGDITSEEDMTTPSSSLKEEKVMIKSYPPHKEEIIEVNLSQNNSSNASIQAIAASFSAANSTAINDTKNNSPTTFKDESQAAVFSMGGGGGGGSTGGGSSSSSSQTNTKKPAAEKGLQPEKTATAPQSTESTGTSNEQNNSSVAASYLPNTSLASQDNQTVIDNQTASVSSEEIANPTEDSNHTVIINSIIEDLASFGENLTLDLNGSIESAMNENPEPMPSPAIDANETNTVNTTNEQNKPGETTVQGSSELMSVPQTDTNVSSNAVVSEYPASEQTIENNESSIIADQSITNQSPIIADPSITNQSPIIAAENNNISGKTAAEISAETASPLQIPAVETDLSRAIRQSKIGLGQFDGQKSDNSNQPPLLKALSPDRASPQMQGTAIFWRAEATDEEGDKILYKFYLDGQEVRKWSKINSWSWLTQGLPAGDYLVTVLARDENHAGQDSFDSIMNASFTLSHPNQAPALQLLKPDSASPQGKGTIITWTASANDPDNDPIYYRFMKNDEATADWSQSGSWVWDTSSEKPGDYRIAVQAKDGLHASKDAADSWMEEKFTLTEPNSVPEVLDLRADRPSPQAAGSKITWTASAVDLDGDKVSYKFLVNDEVAAQWSSSNSWVWDTSAAAPGEYRIRVVARDGLHSTEEAFDGLKDAVMTITAVDSNQPPAVISLVSDTPSPNVQGVTVVWNAEAQDPDGDKILYKFQLNGRDMSRWAESASWKWSTKSLPPGDYKIRVLARDGKHAPEGSSDSSKDAIFTLISEIDQQINQLMNKRKDASQSGSYQSSDIRVTSGDGTSSNVVLGKSNSTGG